jgi:hypothetical protein
MRQPAYVSERKRLEHRGIRQVRAQHDEDTTRSNVVLNLLCFIVPLLTGWMIFSSAQFDERMQVMLFSIVGMLMTAAIFVVLRPKRVLGHAFVSTLLSLILLFMVFVQSTPVESLRYFFTRPFH